MNEFDILVSKVLEQNSNLIVLQTVVEKELLHHDILRIMNENNFLSKLTFIGGTCLRMCYGSERLSEDLDFSSDFDFSKDSLSKLGGVLCAEFNKKYNLPVTVTEPKKEEGNTDTWKIKLITKPEKPDFPSQKINIDICHLPSHDRKIRIPNNYYGINLGTDDLLLYAESMEEILCDKLIAFVNRPNRVKNRDLWDIFWLKRKNIEKNENLLEQKLADRKISLSDYKEKFQNRIEQIKTEQEAFLNEMKRFLFPESFTKNFISPLWWEYLLGLLSELE
ncbi:nucleotidyl transferase AbiEii/AbiGii toxin family protein [Treponema sp. UBA3813]|uniref:nucleotidyl transferase AbiEii/AbiGii toxin family protein n=1 Tax=Treponema sp. UBA3813 TaxID=1947715 RepID=UPI0025E2E118|nr:nucleotidyl transferase AbiEii/AbiGii toxin family protein [Treponema sp. UBA3813]